MIKPASAVKGKAVSTTLSTPLAKGNGATKSNARGEGEISNGKVSNSKIGQPSATNITSQRDLSGVRSTIPAEARTAKEESKAKAKDISSNGTTKRPTQEVTAAKAKELPSRGNTNGVTMSTTGQGSGIFSNEETMSFDVDGETSGDDTLVITSSTNGRARMQPNDLTEFMQEKKCPILEARKVSLDKDNADQFRLLPTPYLAPLDINQDMRHFIALKALGDGACSINAYILANGIVAQNPEQIRNRLYAELLSSKFLLSNEQLAYWTRERWVALPENNEEYQENMILNVLASWSRTQILNYPTAATILAKDNLNYKHTSEDIYNTLPEHYPLNVIIDGNQTSTLLTHKHGLFT